MQKGGVIMDVASVEQTKMAEEAGAVMFLSVYRQTSVQQAE